MAMGFGFHHGWTRSGNGMLSETVPFPDRKNPFMRIRPPIANPVFGSRVRSLLPLTDIQYGMSPVPGSPHEPEKEESVPGGADCRNRMSVFLQTTGRKVPPVRIRSMDTKAGQTLYAAIILGAYSVRLFAQYTDLIQKSDADYGSFRDYDETVYRSFGEYLDSHGKMFAWIREFDGFDRGSREKARKDGNFYAGRVKGKKDYTGFYRRCVGLIRGFFPGSEKGTLKMETQAAVLGTLAYSLEASASVKTAAVDGIAKDAIPEAPAVGKTPAGK